MSLALFRVHKPEELRAHPGQLKASARKRLNRKLRWEADKQEAAKRGIHVVDIYLERIHDYARLLREAKARREAERRRFERMFSARRTQDWYY